MPCFATTKPPAHASAASVPQTMPMIIVGLCVVSGMVIRSSGATRGDFRTADTLGSPAKSICQSKTLTSSGWKAHGEVAESHYYLCCHRVDPHAVDVAASSGDRAGDRR